MGGCAPLGEGEVGPHQTQCGQGRGLPVRQVSSSSVKPFGHNTPTSQTDRTDRTDRQRTDSIGRTVLQTVAPKRSTRDYVEDVTFYTIFGVDRFIRAFPQ